MRSLRYDSDALDAIRGALKTLLNEGVFQIWGVPFRFDSNIFTDGAIQGEIALLWRHNSSKASRQREGFPSWSPLGWENAVSFMYPIDVGNLFFCTKAR